MHQNADIQQKYTINRQKKFHRDRLGNNSQWGLETVSNNEGKLVCLVEVWMQPFLDSCCPRFQLRSIRKNFVTDNYRLHQLADAEQVGNGNVRTAQVRLVGKKNVLHLVEAPFQ